ncbi:probable G-protein coupled receptor 148 [Gadus macrocephalus]|uniref:probable G-protein coupled receptor 148 n=1 Tax=Gadus macrocephalus TaxID=80720 RepID=UPI0028CB375A|nr:probable G-protein coupled receptor 148 [Gadus macrocephalus]
MGCEDPEAMEENQQLVRSLHCAFSNWYNSSGLAEGPMAMSHQTNGSGSLKLQMEDFTSKWQALMPPRHTSIMHVCPILSFLAVFFVVPVIVGNILNRPQMYQETRYILLANVLLSDLLFVTVYMLSTCLNAAGVLMLEWACTTQLFLLAALFSSGILSTMAMVLDTLLAVLVPLRYFALWPVSRTRRAVAGIWAVSLLLPAGVVGVFTWYLSGTCNLHLCSVPVLLVLNVSYSPPLQLAMLLSVAAILLILLLVFSGYVAVCCRTCKAGVWKGESSSRAKGTFLIHYLHLFLSFCPMLVLAYKLMWYCYYGVQDLRADLWLSLVMCNVLLMLPKALAPYLYGFRYRDLRKALLLFYGIRRGTPIEPIT